MTFLRSRQYFKYGFKITVPIPERFTMKIQLNWESIDDSIQPRLMASATGLLLKLHATTILIGPEFAHC